MVRRVHIALVLAVVAFLPPRASGQGETTSAIVGQVSDASGAAVPGATVTVANRETGTKRTASTDETGRFNFPQLKPGTYSVKVEAQGFEPQQNDNVFSGLGQKQTVDFTLKLAQAREDHRGQLPSLRSSTRKRQHLHDSECARARKSSQSRRRSDLPAAVRPRSAHQHGRQRQRFRRWHATVTATSNSTACPRSPTATSSTASKPTIPLTNLNSGLSTNLVLGLNSISEVTVNTLSYSVDQGRYGASQVNYVTKSGTNQFHGNLYELWNGAVLNAADYFTNATPGNHKPALDREPLRRKPRRPDSARQALLLLR